MPVRLIRKWWYIDIRHLGTRYRKRSPSNTKEDALQYEALLRRELSKHGNLDHMHFPRSHRAMRLDGLIDRWLHDYVRVNNRPGVLRGNTYALRNRILPVLGNKPLAQLGVRDIDRLKAHYVGTGTSAKTVNNYLAILHRCLRSAVEWELLDYIPPFQMLKVAPPSFRYLEPEEARRLVTAAPAGTLRTMIVVALQTGLRASELQGLEWQDVDLGRRTLCVRRGVVEGFVAPPKNNRLRYIALSDGVISELEALPRSHERVFPSLGRLSSYATMRRELREIAKAAGVTGRFGWHTLRHSFASHLVSAGAPLKVVQEALGHSSYDMTLRYAHLSPSTMHEAIGRLPILVRPAATKLATARRLLGQEPAPDHSARRPRAAGRADA
jgi:integrase